MRLSRFGFLVLACCLSMGVAAAGNFSYTGAFSQDDKEITGLPVRRALGQRPGTHLELRGRSQRRGTSDYCRAGSTPFSPFSMPPAVWSPALRLSIPTTMAPAWTLGPATGSAGQIRCWC